jgi:type III restriction enzyme
MATTTPAPWPLCWRARAQGLQVGLVVDEATLAWTRSTEFGKFAHWLQADYLLMATATPKDQRLTDFLAHAGYSAQELLPSAATRWSMPG